MSEDLKTPMREAIENALPSRSTTPLEQRLRRAVKYRRAGLIPKRRWWHRHKET